jgi:ABC-type branched-subunit amino acid transport system ATPase component/ABC-type branched-subunit amino acid transport system permease subunit
MRETDPSGGPDGPPGGFGGPQGPPLRLLGQTPSPRPRFFFLWAVVLSAGGIGVAALPRYGVNVVAFGLLYAALATGWSWMRAAGLFSFGQAAFFGAGALTQAWLVTTAPISPWLALGVSAAVGALVALPLTPALRLGPASFGLATLTYAMLLRGLAGNVPAFGMEGFLLPATSGFDGAAPSVVATLAGLALALSLGYREFLGRPSGRAATAIRQAPETTLSLGIDLVGERRRPLIISAAATALAGALYAHLVGSVETNVVFSPTFSVLPLVLGMLGGALHPLGGVLGTLALYPLDELILRPVLPQAHTLAYGLALLGLLVARPEGLLRARIPTIPASAFLRRVPHDPFALAVRHLTVRRNGTAVLTGVDFAVEPGRILRVVGPNGAGKTSLLLAIAGRLPAAEGVIFFGDAPAPRGALARARRGLARTFQAPKPFGEWTVRENVAIAAERADNLAGVDRLLEELQLTAIKDRPAGQLSVGEGKRLEIARALASKPAILLLDEPLAGLSPEAAERVSGLIERVRRQGVPVIWVEHAPAASELASQLLVLENGQVRFLGPPADWEAARRAPPT